MQVREAIDNAKDLNQTLAVLIAAATGADEKKLEGMLKQQEALQAALADLKKQIQEADKRLVDQLGANSVSFKADSDSKKKALDELDTQIDSRKVQLKAIEEKHREKLQDESAALLDDRRRKLAVLDEQLALRSKQVEELSRAAEQYKRAAGAL